MNPTVSAVTPATQLPVLAQEHREVGAADIFKDVMQHEFVENNDDALETWVFDFLSHFEDQEAESVLELRASLGQLRQASAANRAALLAAALDFIQKLSRNALLTDKEKVLGEDLNTVPAVWEGQKFNKELEKDATWFKAQDPAPAPQPAVRPSLCQRIKASWQSKRATLWKAVKVLTALGVLYKGGEYAFVHGKALAADYKLGAEGAELVKGQNCTGAVNLYAQPFNFAFMKDRALNLVVNEATCDLAARRAAAQALSNPEKADEAVDGLLEGEAIRLANLKDCDTAYETVDEMKIAARKKAVEAELAKLNCVREADDGDDEEEVPAV